MILNSERIRSTASHLVALSRTLPSNWEQHRAGGVLTVGTDWFRTRELISAGEIPDSIKADKYLRLSQEKAFRVMADGSETL
ncbi:hypothetical protein J4233_05085 [Candidatus Pacearchaeota archaeon]|nr:hypothetical protein [Candidatus Pacearchaeota archaeon]